MKVAIVYDHQVRPETTGYYCRRALSRLVDVEHLVPEELRLIDPSIFDLFVLVDDGLDYEIPESCRPRAAWAIDTHMNLDRCIQRFGSSESVFAAQKAGARQMERELGRPVHWLPLACDPKLHRPVIGEAKSYDVAFVGHPVGRRRCELLDQLSRRYPGSWAGQAFFDDMARQYSRSRVGFNCSVADDLNMRLFEIPSCGIPLVTNAIADNGLEELFDIGRHLLTYRDEAELFGHIDRLLHDQELAEQLSREGMAHVHSRHTYLLRMQALLRVATQSRTVVTVSGKAHDYFEFDRPDVRALIPSSCHRILDLGCGGGRMGQVLRTERNCHVTGVEASPEAAARARQRLNEVVCTSLETITQAAFPEASFDCIVLADVLEHLRQPLPVLRMCRHWLSNSGSLVISIPNSRHHSVVSGLIDGNWTYERAGLLDDDHVRCLTRRELDKLLFRAGFAPAEWRGIPGSGYAEWQQSGRPGSVRVGSLQIEGLSPGDAEEFFTYQYLVRASRRVMPDYGLTSIIIVTFNQLHLTRQCVDSVLSRTDSAVELIFVDNGSSDGTPDYLQTVPGARVISNPDNLGFAKGVNQGIRIATGNQILLLNNDCIVTTGWLEGLLEVLHDDPRNGLVGPVSNNVSGAQQIGVTYRDLSSLDGFAWQLRTRRVLTLTERLVGFCLLIRREVLESIGDLDEQFEVGCFEDDDFCRRALNAGFRAVIAGHVFVHHFGSATFRGAGFDLGAILQRNGQRFLEKWGRADTTNGKSSEDTALLSHRMPADADVMGHYHVATLPGGDGLLQRNDVRLSLCMIVRDNEQTIEACLSSIYPWVDEIIIVDTGSTDRTPDICRSFRARMYEFPWCDDFSAARNESLQHARGEWIFWMDSDDVIDQDQGQKLRELVRSGHTADCFGYVLQVHCISEEPGQKTIVDHVKVFRNDPRLRFEHRIHEQILPAIRRCGGTVAFTDIFVTHAGAIQDAETRRRKLDRDFRILKLDLERYPDHPFVLFNLGMTYEDCGQYAEAEECLRRSIAVASHGESHLPKAWALLVNSLRQQGRIHEAIETASAALQIYPEDKELLFRRATLFQDDGQPEQAVRDYERVLEERTEESFQSTDPSIRGHKARHNLAIALKELGLRPLAIRQWELALCVNPLFGEAWLAAARTMIELDDLPAVEALLSRLPQEEFLEPVRAVITSLIHEYRNDIPAARQLLQDLWTKHNDPAMLDELARMLVEGGQFASAVAPLTRLTELQPDNAAAFHNLAGSLLATGNHSLAMTALQRSLDLRPESRITAELLNAVNAGLRS